ncbi:hypothetical protein B0O99DRAFT_690756 [Bisporella sp. PMI_857]|nr:hypothetical protein B0O99DRAFT_690756 [Bisporella sp. PMI_857]
MRESETEIHLPHDYTILGTTGSHFSNSATTNISPLTFTSDSPHTVFAMATAEFSKLPRELREEIWSLALLPEPGVYKFDPDWFTPMPDMDSWEDERWMISKRRHPTAMHLCQESRRFSFHIKGQERKQEQENGTVPYYCLGKESLLSHDWVSNITSVIGSRRIHVIENLALSPQCITITAPGTNLPSTWNSFIWNRLVRFMSLRRVDVVLAERFVDEDNDENTNDSSSSDLEKVTEFRLEKRTEGSSTETAESQEDKAPQVRRPPQPHSTTETKAGEGAAFPFPVDDGAPTKFDPLLPRGETG